MIQINAPELVTLYSKSPKNVIPSSTDTVTRYATKMWLIVKLQLKIDLPVFTVFLKIPIITDRIGSDIYMTNPHKCIA